MSTTTVCLVLLPVLVIPCLRPEKKSCFWGGNCTGIAVADSSIIAHLGLHPVAYSGCRRTFRSLPDVQVTADGTGYGSTVWRQPFRLPPDGPWAVPCSKPGCPAMGWPALIRDVPHSWCGTGGTSLPPTGPFLQNVGQPAYFVGCSWDVPLQWWDSPPILWSKMGCPTR
ncbi:hypothetical protein C8R47DRAFT_1073088 [Mycena vitilis]|nr:hypothetical protein C8R47DRAFT_1073088 [Mycena vitilis]